MLIIPIVLNLLLSQETPFCFPIIENESAGAPATWLAFWGSYIAACASFCVAMVSYEQNKEIRRQNNARIEYEMALKRYEELENFILHAEKTYSVNAFENLIVRASDSPENIDSVSVKELHEYLIELNKSSALSIKLFGNNTEGQKEGYYNLLNKLFSQAKTLYGILDNIRESDISDNDEFDGILRGDITNGGKNKYEKFIIYADNKFNESGVGDLHELGFQILRLEWNKVLEKLNMTK